MRMFFPVVVVLIVLTGCSTSATQPVSPMRQAAMDTAVGARVSRLALNWDAYAAPPPGRVVSFECKLQASGGGVIIAYLDEFEVAWGSEPMRLVWEGVYTEDLGAGWYEVFCRAWRGDVNYLRLLADSHDGDQFALIEKWQIVGVE